METINLSDLLDEFGRLILEQPNSSIKQYFRASDNTGVKLVLNDGRVLTFEMPGRITIYDPACPEEGAGVDLGRDPMELFEKMGCEPTEEAMAAKREEYLAILRQKGDETQNRNCLESNQIANNCKVKKESETNSDKTEAEAFEKFMDMQEKVMWANPYLLGPNPEHVVYGLKIAAKMAKELWGWDDKSIEEAIAYAERGIADDDFIRDVNMLIRIWKEDWDMEKIRMEVNKRMGLTS